MANYICDNCEFLRHSEHDGYCSRYGKSLQYDFETFEKCAECVVQMLSEENDYFERANEQLKAENADLKKKLKSVVDFLRDPSEGEAES